MKIKLLPTTPDGWMQMEFTMVGIVIATFMGAALLFGMKIGFQYGLQSCV